MTTISSVSRLSLEEQVQVIYQILSDVYETSPWTLDQVRADLALETSEYFYSYNQGRPVGFLALQHLVGECEVTNLAVLKAFQGQGHAKKLMQELADYQEPIFLEVRASNQAAQGLYQASGFQAIGLRKNYYHAPQEDAVIMRREGNE